MSIHLKTKFKRIQEEKSLLDKIFGYCIGIILGIAFSGMGLLFLLLLRRQNNRCDMKAVGKIVDYDSAVKTGDNHYGAS